MENNLSSVSYIVHVSGTVLGTTTIEAGLRAKDVLITGTNSATLDGNASGSVLTVKCVVPLEIKDITITNGNATEGGGVLFSSSSINGIQLTLGAGVVVTKNKAIEGTAVYIGNSNTLILDGGEIKENSYAYYDRCDGTVYINGSGASHGTFIMKNGTISNNNAKDGGGVYCDGKSTFIMEGGTITGNRALRYGGGVHLNRSDGTFTMKGGTITGNSAQNTPPGGGGFYNLGGGTYTLEGGTITGNTPNDVGP